MPQKNLQLHKFGGSSLADAECFQQVKTLLNKQHAIVVVSATQGTTSAIQTLLDQAVSHQPVEAGLSKLQQHHLELANSLLSTDHAKNFIKQLQKDCDDIQAILHAVQLAGDYSPQAQDLLLGYGEQWSAQLLCDMLGDQAKTLYLNAANVLFTQVKAGMTGIDWAKSQTAVNTFLAGKQFEQLIITGYLAATPEGVPTTLGRNGSDYSATIFAKLLKAKAVTIWTDVDGIYSADPKRVPQAFTLKTLTYEEALELAYFGATIIHPNTMAPAIECNIPIHIKNTFNPNGNGTLIAKKQANKTHPVHGLSSIDDVALVNIEGTGMIGVSGIAARVFQHLQIANISVILISQASSEHSICFAVPKHQADAAVTVLTEAFQFEIEQRQIERIIADKDCAILAIVGEGMVGTTGIADKLCGSLAKANINIRAIAQGSSERNISIVVNNSDINRALRSVHSGFYLANKTISIGLIGPGVVGGTLLDQIEATAAQLSKNYQVDCFVTGIMNSKKMLLGNPLTLKNWRDQFSTCDVATDYDKFINHILADDMPDAVVIDCTANQALADRYHDFIKKGVHIITPNKKANSGDFDYYQQLKQLAKQNHRHYLYETTVCAGLPIIKTLQDLIQTGDHVISIEGIVSGTLGYIFNELLAGKKFSDIIKAAKQSGYTEPDPRDDLSGMDVARKIVCLARELGMTTSLADVTVHNLVPEVLIDCDVATFLDKLPAHDADMAKFAELALAKNEKLAYVGAIQEDGSIDVAIKSYPQNHPFASLQGTDNMLLFRTKRYFDNPLIVRGPGAGAEVTAAGVFADLLRLVSLIK